MAEEHGEYKFNREQRERLDNRRAGAHEHNRMGRGYSLPDWQPYNHNQNHENGKGDLERTVVYLKKKKIYVGALPLERLQRKSSRREWRN